MTNETLLQNERNALWITNVKQKCSMCGQKIDRAIEIKIDENDPGPRVCFLENRSCFKDKLIHLFGTNPQAELVWTRLIEYQPRYMPRVLCGASGKTSKLEIDHKVPVASGGTDAMDNLRTLCFDCNRGKSDSVE